MLLLLLLLCCLVVVAACPVHTLNISLIMYSLSDDTTRVILATDKEVHTSDYINANYIDVSRYVTVTPS